MPDSDSALLRVNAGLSWAKQRRLKPNPWIIKVASCSYVLKFYTYIYICLISNPWGVDILGECLFGSQTLIYLFIQTIRASKTEDNFLIQPYVFSPKDLYWTRGCLLLWGKGNHLTSHPILLFVCLFVNSTFCYLPTNPSYIHCNHVMPKGPLTHQCAI